MKIDQKDRVIISLFAENPNISQEEIAKKINLSQPSVAIRIKKLKENGAIETKTGINPFKMGLYVAKVDISTNNPNEIIEIFKKCPYFTNAYSISGKNNLCLFFVSENIATLEALVNGHIRPHESVSDVDFNIVINTERHFIVPINLTNGNSNKPPCGIITDCVDCKSYIEHKCMGCPTTGKYQGIFY